MGKNLGYTLNLKNNFSKTMDSAYNSTKKMDNGMNGLSSKLAGIGASIGIASLGKQMIETGSRFDSYKTQLKTLLGSQTAASAAFNDIKKDAASTPFDVESLVKANSMLISSGVTASGARNMVMGLGNAIAATGGGSDELSRMAVNLQQIKTLGKASAMDVKQFAFAGIPIYQMLSKTMGISTTKLKEMDITYEQLEASFTKAASAGGMFANGLKNQSNTVGGALSNLGDKWSETLVGFYERLKPVISSGIAMLSSLLDWASRNKDTLLFVGKLVLGLVAVGAAWSALSSIIALSSAVMAANPILLIISGVVALTVAVNQLAGAYEREKRAKQEALQSSTVDGYSKEEKVVNGLIEKYQKLKNEKTGKLYTSEEAKNLAINNELTKQSEDLAFYKREFKNAQDIPTKQLYLEMLSDVSGRVEFLKRSRLKDIGTGGGTGEAGVTPKAATGLNSGVNISAARPQNLTFNIQKLVENLNLTSQNLTEGASKIREEVTKIFFEMVNDVNLIAR